MKEALFYKKRKENAVQCGLCPHCCVILPGKTGSCAVRRNEQGRLQAMNYAKAAALNHDPIEKKPLFHVLPGSWTTSVATVGCNLSCKHCQNHTLSQHPARFAEIVGQSVRAPQVVALARQARAQTIAFTYTEPTIFIEWALDIAQAAAEADIRCVAVTNGFICAQPRQRLAEAIVAANVDLKSFEEDFYKTVCNARLAPVLETIESLKVLGVWVEVTTLLIPGLNDSPSNLSDLAAFLVSIDPSIPWHISRFHPDNEMRERRMTGVDEIQRAYEIGRSAGLKFVYTGNLWGDDRESTICPQCKALLIARNGYRIQNNRIVDGKCPDCAASIEGIWS